MPAVSVKDLKKHYGTNPAVAGVSFSVERGEVFALLGPNGAGKTTTVEILEGMRARDGGSVEVLGYDPAKRNPEMRKRLGIVLQELAVEPLLSVREVLTRNAGYYPHPRDVSEVIELVGLSEKADARVKTLSGGQQRRLDLGLGIIGHPEVIFLDEPTTGFDPSARRSAWELVKSLCAGGSTVILTTHYMDEAEALADHVAVIAKGRIVAEGPPSSLGGRDVGEARIAFRLLDPSRISQCPIRALQNERGQFEFATNDETAVLHALTGWALETETELVGLRVERLTLEDVYLALTGGKRTPEEEDTPGERAS